MLTQRRAGGGILFYSFPSVIQYKRASVCPSVYCYIALRPIIEYIASLLTSEDIRDIYVSIIIYVHFFHTCYKVLRPNLQEPYQNIFLVSVELSIKFSQPFHHIAFDLNKIYL